MKSFKLCSILIVVILMMTITSCVPYRKVVTTPVVPEITIMEKEVVLPEPLVTVVKIRENIMFDYDSDVIDSIQMVIVEEVANILSLYEDTMVVLKGYASSEGGFEYNKELALSRAKAVKAELLDRGIEEDRIDILGVGATKIFGDLLNLNRRVFILDVGN